MLIMRYQYQEEARHIWNNLVPQSGQAESLQGELLRQIEKIAREAQVNGNVNWDGDFEFFCDFLKEKLTEIDVINDEEKSRVVEALAKFKEHGQYARKLYNKEISDEDFDVMKIAYVENDLYDVVRNAIGAFYAKNKELIPYEANPDIRR